MTIKSTLIDLAFVSFIAVASYAIGVVKGHESGVESQAKPLADARLDAKLAETNAARAVASLSQVQEQLATQRRELIAAQQNAATALAARARANAELARASATRKSLERKIIHETPDCSDLQHLPVCPELARRLFQPSGQAAGRPTSAADGH